MSEAKSKVDLDQEPAGPANVARSATLARLFREHNRSLRSFLTARLGDAHEAQEVAQEAYARLLQLDELGAVSFMRAYLFRTAANIATDRTRQRTARMRLDQMDPDFWDEPIDALGPDRQILASEELDLVERALNELPPKYSRAFILHRFENWSTGQIAAELAVQKRMVRNYISRTALYCQLRLEGIAPDQARAKVMP